MKANEGSPPEASDSPGKKNFGSNGKKPRRIAAGVADPGPASTPSAPMQPRFRGTWGFTDYFFNGFEQLVEHFQVTRKSRV